MPGIGGAVAGSVRAGGRGRWSARRRRRAAARHPLSERLFGGAVAAVVVLAVLLPLGYLVVASLSDAQIGRVGSLTLANYAHVLGRWSYWSVVLRTIGLSVASLAIALALGLPLAWLLTRAETRGARVWRALAPAPLFLSPLVTSVAWDRFFTPDKGYLSGLTGGALNGWDMRGPLGIVVLMGVYFSTYVYLYSAPAFANLDARAEQAARVCGAPLRQVLWRITRPLVTPSVISVSTLVLVFAMGLFAIPAVLGWPVGYTLLPLKIYFLISVPPVDYGGALVMSMVTLAITSALLAVYYRRMRRSGAQMATVQGAAHQATVPLGRGQIAAQAYLSAYFAIAVLAPVLLFVWLATHNVTGRFIGVDAFRAVLSAPDIRQTLWNTVLVGLAASVILVAVGVAVAYVVRFRVLGRFGRVVDFVATYPTAIPGVVLSAGLLWAYLEVPGGTIVYGTLAMLVIACVTQFMAISVRSTVAGSEQLHPEMFQAASVSGARWPVQLLRIFIPTLSRHLYGVWLIAMLLSLRELSAVLLLWDSDSQTLPILTFSQWREGDYSTLATLGLIEAAMALALVGVVGALRWTIRRTRKERHA